MRQRPASLILCALLFVYYPLTWLLKISDGSPIVLGDVIFSCVLPGLLLFGLIRVVKFGWYTLIAFGFLWGIRDLYQYYSLQGVSLLPIFGNLFVYLLSLSYFINPRIRHLYFDPKQRWWKTKQRFETHAPMILNSSEQWKYPILRNISEGGCFVETANLLANGDEVNLTIALPEPLNQSVIQARGQVRWVSNDARRSGMGIQFLPLPANQQTAVNLFVRKQL